jgi:hypothetical protein
MMGFDTMSIPFIRRAHECGLGVGRPEEIQIAGEDISKVNFHFRQTQNLASRVGRLFWFGPLKYLEKLMFRTPLVYLFIFGSFFYHDYLWWPIEGKRRMRRIADCQWHKLLQSYKI